ncbi:hypothetical protein PLESTB_001474000 [Pleodorina starrii]|uniref:CobB/CobQ-like glutamine amidotransferase domain-containing protein n=1 Tax=Pleodorina starrii TaxID=330485 RepID=A0A9W6BVM2_9CHLO|nr:hypothetical protein PLESTM_000645400 [Pleodorina starrii]GLC59321.1 hypothetical protein PLESTB_001474000 [Pleodorina starrii]GLC74480.1 hypothetical protein PLESTF_001517300 [Pleodorina starrii]
MRAVFLASKQSTDAVAAWAASLQAFGAPLRHIAAWSGAGELGRRQHGSSACNVDAFLLGPGATLESHLAQYYSGGTGDGLLLVSLEPSPQCPPPHAGVVLLVWQPQVPQDIVQACGAVLAATCLADAVAGPAASSVRGLLLVDASPSLTLSVTHKALEGAGMQALARKPTVLATRTAQAPQAAVQALMQLAEPLPPTPPPPTPAALPVVRIAVARDDAFGPCFPENLTLLQQSGTQLAFFSPLYDGALPAGATCLYLSSGPLEPERWQQLAANRPLLAGVRAFCEAGGAVLAEGAGLLYLSRTLDLEEGVDDGGSKHCVLDMAGVLPFKARLLAEPQSASVQLRVTAGNPLLPSGARPRGYLSAQASLFMVEERQVQSLVLQGPPHAAGKAAAGPHLSTTYEVSVVRQQGAGSEAAENDGAAAPEGYALQNVLASSCLLFLPSEPGLAAHWLRRCACIDAAALAAGVAQQLGGGGGGAVPASVTKLHYPLGSTTCSRAGSRRQSIQDVPALTTAYASSSGVSACGGSASSMLGALGHHSHQQHQQHQQQYHFGGAAQQYHQPSASGCAGAGQPQGGGGGGGTCFEPGAGSRLLCGAANSARPSASLAHSSSAADACGLGLAPQAQPQSQQRRSLCGPAGFPHDTGCQPVPSRSPNPLLRSPHASPLPPMQPRHSGRSSPMGWKDGGTIAAESPAGFLQQGWSAHQNHQQQRQSCGLLSYENELSFKLPQQQHQQRHSCGPLAYENELSFKCFAAAPASIAGQDAINRKFLDAAAADQRAPAPVPDTRAVIGHPTSPRWPGQACRDAELPLPAPGAARSGAWDGLGEKGAGGVGAPPPASTIAISRAASFTDYAPAGSSCSLVDMSYQRRTSGRLEEAGLAAGAPFGYVPWGVTAGTVGLHAGAGASQSCWSPGGVAAGAGVGARHSAAASVLLGPLGASGASGGHGVGVVCCAPGACEALVAMGLANRLAGVGADCDHPPDVCAGRPVVLRWVPAAEAPQGAAARGIRVVPPGPQSQQQHGGGGALGACRRGGGRASAERSNGAAQQRGGGGGGARVLLVDELALRQEPPRVLVLPDMAEMSDGELAQLEQGLVEMGLLSASGGPSATGCTVLHVSCRTLVDVMDFMLELGAAADEPQAASMLLERLQARMRRVVAAAATAAAAGALGCRLPVTAAAAGPAATGPATAPRRPRVLVLQSLQPMVEPGRWVPEMLALAGASSCLAQPGGQDVALSWQDVRERAAPDVLIILTSPGGGAGGADGGAGGATGQQAQGPGPGGGGVALPEQLAALASQPGWWCLPAVRVSQVYLLQGSYCVRPGPRLVDGVELLARLLLPGHYSSSRKVPPGALMRLSLAAGQRCRATLLPSYFVPVTFN